MNTRSIIVFVIAFLTACAAPVGPRATESQPYDLVIRNGTIYDGSGKPPVKGDVAVANGHIVAVGDLPQLHGRQELDAGGLAVAPGFVNMLSWAVNSLLVDGRGESDLKQGVTLEVFGEGWSMGPLNDAMKAEAKKRQGEDHVDTDWTTLGEYLDSLQRRGVSLNVASFVGATTVRINVLGEANRAPNADELARMQALVRQAMEEGALGVGSALIYAPGNYAQTDELKALVAAAAPYGGGYISHMRSEGDKLLEGIDELIDISRSTGAHAELYHMKAAGHDNWNKMGAAIRKIEKARAEGVPVSANMYTYTAGGTGLNACMDPAIQAGGLDAWIDRLKQPDVRAKVVDAMFKPAKGWENICYASGTPDRILIGGFKLEKNKPLTGKSLEEIAKLRGESPADTIVDLIIEEHSGLGAIYFIINEDNVKLGLSQPWVSLGSDEGAYSPNPAFLKDKPHPRAYGTFARFLGKYVRDEKVDTLSDAIRRLTSLPCENFKMRGRGRLEPGYAADIVVFDPATIADHATFDEPRQFATGVKDVFVNGVQVLKDGEHTGAKPGQFVHGPGWRGKRQPEG